MLDIVSWLWKPHREYRSQFGPEHVNTLFRMVQRNYNHPHRFSVITDQPDAAYENGVRVIPLWGDHKDTQSVYGVGSPNCHRRLKAFAAEMTNIIGKRFVSVDLDAVILDDMAPVWHRKEDFIIWGDDARRTPYNGSMWMMNAGARKHVWDRFSENPQLVIERANRNGFYGSDQAVLCYILGANETRWTARDGVFSYRMHVKNNGGKKPEGARIVFFEGHYDPWNPITQQQCPWIAEHYK